MADTSDRPDRRDGAGGRGADCTLGLIALGDSVTFGPGEPAFGVTPRSWALWLAEATRLPYTNLAANGALSADLLSEQLPQVEGRYDLACLYVGINDARHAGWSGADYERNVRDAVQRLTQHARTVLLVAMPADLGRPPAGGVDEAREIVRRIAAESGAVLLDLREFGGWRNLMPDMVHPTALGQLRIADAAAVALSQSGVKVSRLPSDPVSMSGNPLGVAGYALSYARKLVIDLVRRTVERALAPRARRR